MTESIHKIRASAQLADETAVSQVDSFGNGNDNGALFRCQVFHFFKEIVHIKWNLRKINQVRTVTVHIFRKCCGSSQPAGMTSHNLNDTYGWFGSTEAFVVADDFLHGCCNVFCSRAVTRCVVCQWEVIIDCFRNSHEFLWFIFLCGIIGKHLDSVHGIISTDIEEIFNVVFFHDFKHFIVYFFISLNLWKLITAGAEKSGWCSF